MTKQSGFTLLEILVAFVIMALSLGILLQIFSSGVNAAIVAEDYTNAVQIAESLLAETGAEIPLQPGYRSGIEADTYHWRVNIFRYEMQDMIRGEQSEGPVLMQVEVSVSWGENHAYPRSVDLKTLKWANNGTPQ